MTEQELQRILEGESNSVDWKAGGDPKKIVETLAAFANDYEESDGGTVVCGIAEIGSAPSVAGISRSESKRLRDRIFELSRSLVTPPIEPTFESVPHDKDKELLLVSIAPGSEIHFFMSKVVVRLGDKVTNATDKQHSKLAQRKAHLDWLAQPCPGATLKDINQFALAEISKHRGLAEGPADLLKPGFGMFGSAPPLVSKMGVPNRFALLLAGEEPQRFLPGAYVGMARFQGVTRGASEFVSNEFFGPIPRLVEQVMDILRAEASIVVDKNKDFLSGAQNRRRYSEDALREILVNALAHRDYQDGNSTKVSVFQDRIEFDNPGGLVSHASVEEAKRGDSRWRNPALARYLVELGLAQERGTGLRKAIEQTRLLAGVEPVFEVGAWFRVTVPAYRPPSWMPAEESVSPQAGVLVMSLGYGSIDIGLIRRSNVAFREMDAERILSYHHSGLVLPEQWPELIHELRDWLRDRMEDPRFQELHLFYRGPVIVGPLIGAMSVGRKPILVYVHDEDAGQYRLAYRIDRRLLQET